jgi:hypothetical protein
MSDQKLILVIGGTGAQGSPVVQGMHFGRGFQWNFSNHDC